MPKTTVTIEWDSPNEQQWLCADNIAFALSASCKNTKFIVTELTPIEDIAAELKRPMGIEERIERLESAIDILLPDHQR